VFSTAADYANPTLTIVALAARLADYIKTQMPILSNSSLMISQRA
jgi:hypothetical protein